MDAETIDDLLDIVDFFEDPRRDNPLIMPEPTEEQLIHTEELYEHERSENTI
jgi:hypothetical protein